jgi:hypothetical protein
MAERKPPSAVQEARRLREQAAEIRKALADLIEESIRLRAQATRLSGQLGEVSIDLIAAHAAARRNIQEAAQCYLDAMQTQTQTQSRRLAVESANDELARF